MKGRSAGGGLPRGDKGGRPASEARVGSAPKRIEVDPPSCARGAPEFDGDIGCE